MKSSGGNSAALESSCLVSVLRTLSLSSRFTLLFYLYKISWQYHMPKKKATPLSFFPSRAIWWHSQLQPMYHTGPQTLPATHGASISSVPSPWFHFHSWPCGFSIPLPVFTSIASPNKFLFVDSFISQSTIEETRWKQELAPPRPSVMRGSWKCKVPVLSLVPKAGSSGRYGLCCPHFKHQIPKGMTTPITNLHIGLSSPSLSHCAGQSSLLTGIMSW